MIARYPVPVLIRQFATPEAAAAACAASTLELLSEAKRLRGRAWLAVSGGNTPRPMLEAMSAAPFDWSDVEVFQVDERAVPPEHHLSNYRMIRQALTGPAQIHRMRGELAPAEAAALYEAELGEQQFDVIQRGMGADGHTASLFPGLPVPRSEKGRVGSIHVPAVRQERITLMPRVLESTRATLCLVTGTDKADALYEVLRGPRDIVKWPAQIASPVMIWFIDAAAGARLK